MEWLTTIILAVVQGVTEPLPVSSSAHLIILPWMLGWAEPSADLKLTFDLALHLGTTLALVAYFWKDIAQVLAAFFPGKRFSEKAEGRRLGFAVLAGCVPAGAAALLFEKQIETFLRTPAVAVAPLVVFGALLYYADHRRAGARPMGAMTVRDALVIGLFQSLALVPGVSRSGVTITGGLLRGFRRDEAARFSFLMITPLVAGAALLKARDVFVKYSRSSQWDHFAGHDLPLMALGMAVSFVVGLLCIGFLIRFLKRFPLDVFVWYRLALAGAVLAVFLTR